jgi:hypothetical protein
VLIELHSSNVDEKRNRRHVFELEHRAVIVDTGEPVGRVGSHPVLQI